MSSSDAENAGIADQEAGSDDREPESVENQTDAPAKPKRKPGPLRLKAAILLPLLFGGAALAYYFMIDSVIEGQLLNVARMGAGEGGDAEVEHVSFSIFGPKLEVRGLRSWQELDGQKRDVLNLGEAVLDVEFWPLLERRLVVNEVSVTAVSYSEPRKVPKPREDDLPEETSNDTLNEYLGKAREFLESVELDDLRGWLETLKKYTEKKDPEEPDVKPEPPKTVFDPGPADRAWFVKDALLTRKAEPRVLFKRAALQELNVSFGRDDGRRFFSKVTDLALTADSVSSDPVAYGEPMLFKAAGNLDGSAERRVEIGLTLRFDRQQLVALEQVDGSAAIGTLNISSLVDADVFGDTLREAKLSLVRYGGAHAGMPDRTRLSLAGVIQAPGFDSQSKASFALWFGGYAGGADPFAPSGISIQVEDFPLAPVLQLAGESPLPVESEGATITFGTCDEQGNFGTPGAAFTWHDGVGVRLRLKVNGARFSEQDGDLAGLPAPFVLRGLNGVVDGMGGLDVVVGFQGRADQLGLELERPGLRGFVDAVVNALEMTAPELESVTDLPFNVSGPGIVRMRSVNADGSPRTPALDLATEPQHDLNDLRVSLNLRDVVIAPKAGHDQIAGLPAADFCRAFNTFMTSLGDEGLSVRTRVMNERGVFSPALESPGTRGLVDAMIGVSAYTGAEFAKSFDLPVNINANSRIQLASVDEKGDVRGLSSPGADSDSLQGMRVRAVGANLVVSPKPGQPNVLGIPAPQFCTAFNTFLCSQGESGLTLLLGVFDSNADFSPTLHQPGTRGLLDAVTNTQAYNGAQLNSSFDLPFKLADEATAVTTSVDKDGKKRTIDGAGSESHDLGDLTLQVLLKDGAAVKKVGHDTILGMPADHFTFAWNKLQEQYKENGFPMKLRLFDNRARFAPTLAGPSEQELLKQLSDAVGINDLQKNFSQLATKYASEFPAFQHGGLEAAKELAKGNKLPELPKELPKLPDPPKLPEPPKLPGLPK